MLLYEATCPAVGTETACPVWFWMTVNAISICTACLALSKISPSNRPSMVCFLTFIALFYIKCVLRISLLNIKKPLKIKSKIENTHFQMYTSKIVCNCFRIKMKKGNFLFGKIYIFYIFLLDVPFLLFHIAVVN